jgi:PAS domain S-box-containing protein
MEFTANVDRWVWEKTAAPANFDVQLTYASRDEAQWVARPAGRDGCGPFAFANCGPLFSGPANWTHDEEARDVTTNSTASELRKTGISVIGDIRWGTHFCYFYETKQDLLETLVLYFKEGLESKEFCVWVVSPILSVEEAKHALGRAVPDLERHLAEGTLEIHSHHEWYLRDGRWDSQRVLQAWREKINHGSANGHVGLRAAGDAGWIQNEDWMGFREYEKQVSAILANQRSIILCTYPLTTSSGDQVFDVAHIHDVAVARRNGTWETIEIPALKEAKAAIRKLNEELEEKVEERTRELAATNEALRSEIAERKLAEEAVKQAEDRIRLVIDTIPTMAWTLRPDGAIDFVNQRWLDYTGLSLEEAIEDAKSIVHPEDLPGAVAEWRSEMASGSPHEDEVRLRGANGEYRWFLLRIAPLRDAQGNVVKWYGVSIDIEDRKQAEMQSRMLIDAIPHQIWSAPPDGGTDYCNERWRSYSGLELEDLRGEGWQAMLHPEDRDRVLKAWHESVANGTPYEQEERHRRTDGTYRWFLSLAVPLRDAEGRIVRWYGTNTDIEERKRAEEALRRSEKLFAAFMDHLPGFAWMKDIDGRYVYVNKKEAELDVYRDGAIGKTDPEFWPAEIAAAYRINDQQVITTRKAVRTVEPSLMNGDHSYMLVSKFPIFDQDGSVVMVAGAGVDITDLTEAKNALNAQALRYKTLMATSTDSIYVLDENGDLQEANAAFLRQRGYTEAEVKGLNVADWDAQWSPEQMRERLRGLRESSAVFETRHLCKDGSLFDVEVCATGVRIAEEQLFFCVTRDITERKQAERALRESEARFRRLLASNIIGVVFWTLQGDIFEANDLFLNMIGYTREDLRQGRIGWKNLTPPEYAAVDEKALAELMATGTCFPFEKEYVRKDGSRFSVLIGSALLEPHKETGSSFVMDISERKQAEDRLRRSEEKFKTLFGIAPVGISVLDRQHNVIDANPALEQITRLRREELLNGTNWDRRILNADGTPMRSHEFPSERAMAENRPVNDVEAGIVTENGETIWVQVSVAPLDLPGAGAVVITQDITERKRAAEALEAANHQLRILSRQLFHIQEEERRHLARELHDEIGQTLTAAKINLKIIAPDVPAKITGRLDDSIQLLDQLLRQVRQLSLDLRPPLLDELGLVPTLRWLVDQQAQRAGLRVTFTANVDGLEIEPDVQTACFRVAQEAITNIIRHSGAKSVTVELRREMERLTLSVRDDGAGFDPAMIQQRTAQHSTLGLVSMKERALLVRGGFEIHSAPGQGAEIRAWFPLPNDEHPSTAETA